MGMVLVESLLRATPGVSVGPKVSTRTLIGIAVAISGNVLISLALNLQKLAHKRLDKEHHSEDDLHDREGPSLDEQDEDRALNGAATDEDVYGTITAQTSTIPSIVGRDAEMQPLLNGHPATVEYGIASPYPESPPVGLDVSPRRSFMSRFRISQFRASRARAKAISLPVDIVSEEAALHGLQAKKRYKPSNGGAHKEPEANEGEYLKSKLWWLGFVLMNVGETGNFISYAFAPASVVAPLGTFALMANCFFAPLLLGEHFRKRDLVGVVIAIIGAVTVVLASNGADTTLDPEALIRAISQTPFMVYTCIYIVAGVILATLSEGKVGKTWVFVDVGLCALFGGFTVLSTKAISTLLTSEWIELFKKWITYPLLIVLFGTGVGQIRYLNRALMRFDSKVVIPIQFVLFTLSAIIGSAILYGDFKKAQFHQVVTFLYGCAATFVGVFIIAWNPSQALDDLPQDEAGESSMGDIEVASPVQGGGRLGMGTIGRRKHATLVLPSGVSSARETPSLRTKRNSIATMGISPAQHLLLVHTPPRDTPHLRNIDWDSDNGTSPSTSYRRPRAMSAFDQDGRYRPNDAGTRDSSLAMRIQNGSTRVGSLDA